MKKIDKMGLDFYPWGIDYMLQSEERKYYTA